MQLVDVGLIALAATFLVAVARIAVGPTEADRAVGADLAFYVLIAAVALVAVRWQQPVFFDIVLVATLVGFIASVTLARLVDRDWR